jgi:hypothetical protein
VLRGVASVDPLVERTTLARMAGLEESTAYVDEHGIPEETWPGGVRSGSPKSPAGRCRGSRRSNGRGACSGSLVHLYVHAVVVAAPPGVRSGGLFDRGCLRCRRARCRGLRPLRRTSTASRRRTNSVAVALWIAELTGGLCPSDSRRSIQVTSRSFRRVSSASSTRCRPGSRSAERRNDSGPETPQSPPGPESAACFLRGTEESVDPGSQPRCERRTVARRCSPSV